MRFHSGAAMPGIGHLDLHLDGTSIAERAYRIRIRSHMPDQHSGISVVDMAAVKRHVARIERSLPKSPGRIAMGGARGRVGYARWLRSWGYRSGSSWRTPCGRTSWLKRAGNSGLCSFSLE